MKNTKRYAIVEHYRDATPGFKEHVNRLIKEFDDLEEIKKDFTKYKNIIIGYNEYSYYICDFKNDKNISIDKYSNYIFSK